MYNKQKLCKMFFLVKGRPSSFHTILEVKDFLNFCSYLDIKRIVAFPLGKLRGNYYA